MEKEIPFFFFVEWLNNKKKFRFGELGGFTLSIV